MPDGDRPLLLQLDSGIDVPLLFECGRRLPHVQTIGTAQRHRGTDEVAQALAFLTPQDMRVGSHSFHQISFMTPIAVGKDIAMKPDVDGVLPTALFRNAFISYSDNLAVLQQ